jgi:hypothetical protein
MNQIDINLTKKQSVAWKLLMDDKTNIVTYGGSAGGGKSFIGCLWIATLCLKHPGIRCLIGRAVLAQLKMTTLNTLFETLERMGLKANEHFVYNAQSNVLTFNNKSSIILKDLAYYPSDPLFSSLGGYELTAIMIDEASEVSRMAYDILRSRIRFKLNEYKLIPKILLTCNPAQVWIKSEFYQPYVEDRLPDNMAFVPALPYDNPHLPESYIEMLKTLPEMSRRRLLEGDWNYLDASDAITSFDDISQCVYKFQPSVTEKKYLTIDVARYGSDRSVIGVWVGLALMDVHIYTKTSTTELANEIKSLMQSHGVHPTNCIIDSDGVGGGVADMIRGTNFVNNASPFHNQNFTNLKSQCYVKVAEMLKEGQISINIIQPELIDELTQELLSVKLKNLDKDTKIGVQSKDEMKKTLGRSPDLADMFAMRMYPVVKQFKTTGRYSLTFI